MLLFFEHTYVVLDSTALSNQFGQEMFPFLLILYDPSFLLFNIFLHIEVSVVALLHVVISPKQSLLILCNALIDLLFHFPDLILYRVVVNLIHLLVLIYVLYLSLLIPSHLLWLLSLHQHIIRIIDFDSSHYRFDVSCLTPIDSS